MPRSHFTAAQSAQLRERIAREAARLLMRGKVKSFHTARTRAARWLSQEKLTSAEFPTQEEIALELQSLTKTDDWDQLTRIDWVIEQTYLWLSACEPWLNSDWKKTYQIQQVTIYWLIDNRHELQLKQILLTKKIGYQRLLCPDGTVRYEFYHDFAQVVFVAAAQSQIVNPPDQNDSKIRHITIQGEQWQFEKADLICSEEPFELQVDEDVFDSVEQNSESDWSEFFRPLLKMQEHLDWNSDDHPEGNVLYHTLQVYELGRERYPWDEEFLWACLLHDLGLGIDARNPLPAALRILEGRVSERVLFLISELPAAQEILSGAVPRKSLRKSESYEELLDLARCDRDGRQPGKKVGTLDEALDYLKSLDSLWEAE